MKLYIYCLIGILSLIFLYYCLGNQFYREGIDNIVTASECALQSKTYNLTTQSCEPCPNGTTWNATTKLCAPNAVVNTILSCAAQSNTYNATTQLCEPCPNGTTWNAATKLCAPNAVVNTILSCAAQSKTYNATTLLCEPCPNETTWNATTSACAPNATAPVLAPVPAPAPAPASVSHCGRHYMADNCGNCIRVASHIQHTGNDYADDQNYQYQQSLYDDGLRNYDNSNTNDDDEYQAFKQIMPNLFQENSNSPVQSDNHQSQGCSNQSSYDSTNNQDNYADSQHKCDTGKVWSNYVNKCVSNNDENPYDNIDKYILKTQAFPPVCPVCAQAATQSLPASNVNCQPCPACARCPEPSFDCKKVPNNKNENNNENNCKDNQSKDKNDKNNNSNDKNNNSNDKNNNSNNKNNNSNDKNNNSNDNSRYMPSSPYDNGLLGTNGITNSNIPRPLLNDFSAFRK